MTWKIQLQWVLLLHIFSLWTTVVQASVEVRTDNLRRGSRNPLSGIVNANIRGHMERFLKRVVREADDILEVLNSAATTKSSDVFVIGEIEELELLLLPQSQNIQMYVWNKTVFSCIIDDSENLKILSLDFDAYKTTLIAEIHKVTNCDMTAVSKGKLIITCIGSHLVEGDGNVKTYILEKSVAGSYDLQYIHLIEARGFSHISMWHQQGEIMLMICSMTTSTAFDTSVTGQSNLYRWTGAYFDNIQVFSPANASSSHHFVISNQHFIAEAHFADNKGHHNCYSYIYRYSAASKMYVPLQLLPTKGAKHFTSFVLNASGRSNAFLAVANSCQDDHGGKCNPFTTSGIYCYHHDRFVLFQEIPTANAIQWLAIEVENNVLLAVANALTGVRVYQYNGWRFVPAESQYTQGSFGVGVTGLAGVKLEEKIILGGVNGNSVRELPVFFEVKLKRENFFQTYHDDLEKWCSARLRSIEESSYPDARAVTVPLSNNSKYSFNKSISIDGDLILLQQGNVDKVLLRSTNTIMPGVPVGLSRRINSLKERSKLIADTTKRTVPITGNVTWPAKLHFRSLDSASSKSINVVDDVIGHFLQVNGLPINNDNLALLDDVRVISRLNFSQVEVKADVKANSLAGHPFTEYVTLSREHTFKKDVIFAGNFDVQEVNAEKIISETVPGNQRYLSIGNINFKDYIHCSSASATKLECQTLNGINVTKLQEDIIITGEYNFVRGKLEVDGNLTYRGNLQSNVIGSINLETPLKLNSFSRPKISGSHRILSIKTNWLEGQTINGIHVPEQLLVNRSDSSYVLEKANFPKVSAQSIFVESNLDTIKVRNGSLDVMKVNEDQFITSRKAFKTIRLSSQSLRRNKRAASAENQVRDKSLVSPDNLYKHFGWDESLIQVANFVRCEAELSNLVKLLHTSSGGNILIPSCYFDCYQVLKKLYLPHVNTHTDELLCANCAINSKNSWKLQSIPVSQDDIDSVTYNAKLYKSLLKETLKEVNFKRNISVMSKISKVNLIPAVKKHLPLMKLFLSVLHQIFNSSKIIEEKSDVLYFLCDTVRQIGQYPAIVRRLIGSSSKAALFERALIDLVVIQFLSSAPEYGDIFHLLRKPPSCLNFEDKTYFVGVSKILQEFQDIVNSTSLKTSIRYKRDPEDEETFLRHGKGSGKVSRSHISSTEHDSVTKVGSWYLSDLSVRSTSESVMDGTHEGSLLYSLEVFSSHTSHTNKESHFRGFSSPSLDLADFDDSSLVSMISPISWVDRSSGPVAFSLDFVESGSVSVPMFSSKFSKIDYRPTVLMSGMANSEIDILNFETALTVKQPLSKTAANSTRDLWDSNDYDYVSNETAQLLNGDYNDYVSSAGTGDHLGLLYSETAITVEQPLSETATYLIRGPSAYNDFASNVGTRDCSRSLATVVEEESTVDCYFSPQKDMLSTALTVKQSLSKTTANSTRDLWDSNDYDYVSNETAQLLIGDYNDYVSSAGTGDHLGLLYSETAITVEQPLSETATYLIISPSTYNDFASNVGTRNCSRSLATVVEEESTVDCYFSPQKDMLSFDALSPVPLNYVFATPSREESSFTTVEEIWKTPAFSFPDKTGMEGHNGEISGDKFGFTYSTSNFVRTPMDVSPSFDVHPSLPDLEDLAQSSTEMGEYDSIVDVYPENDKLEDGCISCVTTVKEIWKTPAFSSPDKVGMEGYNGEISDDNFDFTHIASNLLPVPEDVSPSFDVHPSSPTLEDLAQSSTETGEYDSIVDVYPESDKLEDSCRSCVTTVKEIWKTPAISSPDKVGMEGYNGVISDDNFDFTHTASNLLPVPEEVSPSFDAHPSSPVLEDLEQSSAKTREYDSVVNVYHESGKLEESCVSCVTTVKEIWKTPAFSSPDKVGMEGYNGEISNDNFGFTYSPSNLLPVPGFTYSASNLVLMPVDVSPSFDVRPSLPVLEDLAQSSTEMSEYDSIVDVFPENEKLEDHCISCVTTVKEIWETPAFSSPDKVGMEGYNGEISNDNFGFIYSASNLVTMPEDVSPFDIHPSSPNLEDLAQSSAETSEYNSIVDVYPENEKLEDGCISCDNGKSLEMSSDTVKATDTSSRVSILEHSGAYSISAIYYTDVFTSHAVGEVTKTLPILEEGRVFIPQKAHSFYKQVSVSLSEETLELADHSNRNDNVPSPIYVLPLSGIDRNLQDFHTVTTVVKNNYPVEVTLLSSQQPLSSAVFNWSMLQESKVPGGSVRERYLLNAYKTAMNSFDSEISMLPIDNVYPTWTTLAELLQSSTLDIIPALSVKASPVPYVKSRPVPVSQTEDSSFLNWQQHIINSKEFSDGYVEQGSLVSSSLKIGMNAKGIVKYGTYDSWKLTESLPVLYSRSASKYDTDDASGSTAVWHNSVVIVDTEFKLSSSSVKNYISSENATHKQTGIYFSPYNTVDVTEKYKSETKYKSILLKVRPGDSETLKENVFVLKKVKDLSANSVSRSINTTSARTFESTSRPGEAPSASVIVTHSVLPPSHSLFHVGVPSGVSNTCHPTVNTYITQHRTYIKCISCTFIFKSYMGVVPSTLLVQNFPVTKTQDQLVYELNEPLEFEEVDFNKVQITTFPSDRVADAQYSVITPSVPSVIRQDISNFTDINMINVATAYSGYNYHDFSEDVNERNTDVQHSSPPASTTEVNAVKVGRAYHGGNYHESSEDATTTNGSTKKLPEYFVSDEHLENIVNFINEFRRFASNNFSQSRQYSDVVGKNIEVIINCSYNYFWTLRHKFASMISNNSYFDDCRKRLEFVQKLSGHYAFSPNDIVLLTTLRDAPWLNELISILDIKLRKSRGQPVTVEEEVKLRNIAETDDKTLSSPPPMGTVAKEAIYGKINKISNLREIISRFRKRQNKGHISRLIREAGSVPYDIHHLSDEFGKYSKEDPLFIVTHWEAFQKLVEDYFRFKTYYFSRSGIHTDEIDKLLKKNDVLLEIFERDLANLESNEKSKLNYISDRLHKNAVDFPSLRRKYFSLSLDEPTSHEKMLLEYYCNLDEMLYTLIFEAVSGSNLSEEIHAIVNEMQENMDILSEYIWGFYKKQHDLPSRSEEKFVIRLNWNNSSNVNEKVLTQWQSLSGDIASVCKSVMTLNGLQKADCSGISKQILGSAFSLDALNVSRVLVKYLKSINFLLLDINKIDVVNEDVGLHVNLTDCLLNVLTTTKSIISDVHLSHKRINSDTLRSHESCLNATIGFIKKPGTLATSQFFQNLDYLKPLILYTLVETKYAIDCLQALDFEYESQLNQPPVILRVPVNAQNSSYGKTTIFKQTVDHSANHSVKSSFLCDRDVGHLEYLLNLTRKIIHMNPMNKTKVFSKSEPPDSIAVSSTASDVLLTLNSIINYLQQCTSGVSLDDLDELLKNHQLLMKDIEGHISPLSDEAKLKVLMIYGETLGGRAAAAENLILRDIEKRNLTAESKDEFEVFGFFVHGRVAKYDLKELSVLPSPLSPASATSLKYIDENMNKLSRVIIQGGLFVSAMNEVNAEYLTQHAVPVSRIRLYGNIHFRQKVVVVGDMKVERINDLMAENFVLCKGNPEFSLPVTFVKDIHIDGNVALTDLINDMDISSFSKRIVLTNSRHIVIEKDITFTNLKAERVNSRKIKISGVPLEKVVKKGEEFVLTGNKTFQSLQVADSTRISALDVQYINDLNIPVMFRDSLWKNSDEQQMITYVGHLRTFHVNNSLTTRGISYLNAHNNYSTVHLPRLLKNVIYSDRGAVVSRVVVRGNANVLSLFFFNTLDGTPSDTFSNGWLLKTVDQTISGKIYAADISSYSVVVKERGRIFDVDIERLNHAVKVNESIAFISDITVAKLLSDKSILVEGLVQSMNISVEGISKLDEVVIITAPKLFLASTFAKTLSLSGLINSIHLGKHCHTTSSRNISIIGSVHFIQNTFAQSLKFDSNSIDENFLEVYWHKDINIEIRYIMTFKHLSVVEVNATVNNVDLRGLDSKILHRTCNDWNRLQGQSYIKNLITKALHTKSVLGSTLNGLAIESFGNLLQKTGNQVFTGNVAFNRISIEGNVSTGPRSLSDVSRFCRYQEICVVSAAKYFDSYVIVKGNIIVNDDKTLQGVDISDVFVNVLSNLGHVFGTTEFKGNVRLTELGVNGHVDSITVTKETLLLRAGSQIMSGLVTVNSSLARAVTTPEIKTDEWAVGLMDVNELSAKAVHQEINNILHSPVFFENEVKFNFGDMELEHMTAGLQSVDPEIVFSALKNLSFLNQNTVRGQVLELKGWQQVQVFKEPIERIMPVDLTVQSSSIRFTPEEEYLALVSSVGNTRILTRNFTQQHFNDPGISLEGDCAQKVIGYTTEYNYNLLTSHSCPANYQPENDRMRVWEFNPQDIPFVKLSQSILVTGITDMDVVALDDKVCVLIASNEKNHVSLYCQESKHFVSVYSIEEDAQKLSVLHPSGEIGSNITLFAVASRGKYPQERGYFAVWSYDFTDRKFSRIQKIELEIVVWVDVICHQKKVFIAVVSQSRSGNHLGQVSVYRMDLDPGRPLALSRRVHIHQQILVKNPFEAHFSKLDLRLSLFIIDQNGYISWYSQKGIQRFVEVGKLHMAGKQQLEVWLSHVNESYSHWVAVSGEDCNYKESVYNRKDTQIIQSVLRGRRFLP
ncbi:uncharacterized protein [Macrobrachium rosenbergii]|uniref:uncharacterized protein n=1 Tax=Macrobrachium rosenbergii TaxID=79674 RepID=UPI0034D7045A